MTYELEPGYIRCTGLECLYEGDPPSYSASAYRYDEILPDVQKQGILSVMPNAEITVRSRIDRATGTLKYFSEVIDRCCGVET